MNKNIIREIKSLVGDVKCPLNYNKDYELLIAVMLSAQTTDVTVNKVTAKLFEKYDLHSLAEANEFDVLKIVSSCGMKVKAKNAIGIAKTLVEQTGCKVPNNREFLESLPGVGHKTANVVLSELFGEQALAVDTHVARVAKRLGIASETDDILTIENKLMKFFSGYDFRKLHLELLMFGRNICKSKNPTCDICPFKNKCQK